MKRDVNNIPVLFKELLIQTPINHFIGTLFLRILNRLEVTGREHLTNLPRSNVLFVSNHQTFYMEGIALMTEFNRVKQPFLHWFWKAATGRCYYIVAVETAQIKGWMNRLIEWAGAVTVTRTWRRGDRSLQRGEVTMENVKRDQAKIVRAIKDGWVITFPQGTITPFLKGRKGTAYIIKEARCIVVPVVIDGFSKAFKENKLCSPLKLPVVNGHSRSLLTMRFKAPMDINFDDPADVIIDQIMDAIEQSERFRPEG
jgi:1-acyl-sn-glycerol-3-phosphate acyltransferase